MLCPCCGDEIAQSARACGCGARFVGEPLDEAPIQVLRYGPLMNAILMLVVVTCATLLITKWLAFAGLLAIRSAWRALRLARREPGWYGGYTVAMAALVVAIVGGAIAGAYGITRIPKYFEGRQTRRVAATHAAMHHIAGLLEDYKRTYGSYPRDMQEIKKAIAESLPADYWNKSIKYQSDTGAIADRSLVSLPVNNFELRSAGLDGKEGTDDDIIMRDGLFVTNAEIQKQPIVRSSPGR